MKATEFVREFTVFGAKEYLAGATFYKDKLMVFTDIDDLKQIVDAFELVESLGGVDYCKCMIKLSGNDYLKKAINLVEQCQ